MTIYRMPEFTKVVTEYFDTSDRETFSYLSTIEEEDQSKVMIALTAKLYEHMVDKVDDIDFGDIPKSRGDITKLPNYEKVLDCVNIIKGILASSKQDMAPILSIDHMIKNLVEYKDTFVKAYQLKSELPIVIYNTAVLSIYSGISLLISSCIEFVKSPDGTGFDIALDKVQLSKTKESLLFKDLEKLNKSFEHGELPKALDVVIKQKINVSDLGSKVEESATGFAAGVLSIGAVIYTILNIIPILREMIYFYYYIRVKVSDFFDAQSALLQMNAYNLAARSVNDEKDVKEIQNKQLKIADKFKKFANMLSVKFSKGSVSAEKETKDLEKKLKIDDVKDSDIKSSLW